MFKLKHFKNLISFYSQTVFYHFFSTSPFHKLYHKTPYNMVSVLQHSIHIIKIYFSLEPKKTVMFKLKHFKNLISFYSQTVFYHFFSTSPFHKLYHKTPYNMVNVLQHSIHIIKIYFSLEPKKTVMFKLKHFKNLISFYSQTVFYHFFQHPPFISYTKQLRTTW